MRLIRDEKAATFTLVPVEQSELDLFARLLPQLKKGDTFTYCGREKDGKFCKVHFRFGSTPREKVTTSGSITFRETIEEGGIHLVIAGSTEDDKGEVYSLRNACYFGSCKPIFIDTVSVDGVKAMVITLKFCKHCQAPMISTGSVEWSTCPACAEKCEHTYEEGLVHGGDAGTGAVGEFCTKCGRGKPRPQGERVKTDAENKVEIEQKLGITWNYTNTPLTAAQIVAATKAAGIIPAE